MAELPVEVELIYELMPCNAMRTAQEPIGATHPCTYFRKWGTYHSFDYAIDGPPPTPGILQRLAYVGRAQTLPEPLSGCRKAPIVAVGINPNLPGWHARRRGSLNPLFDDYRQYAHYFRYRAVAKLRIPRDDYQQLGGGPADEPFAGRPLEVPEVDGIREVPAELDNQSMYVGYQGLLDELATTMGWSDAHLAVGEDLAYANMVACPSARWTIRPLDDDPAVPPMTVPERDGIVTECFRSRRYFLRQLFQSLPRVLLVFSQSTANAFISELRDAFTMGAPTPGEPVATLLEREVRLRYGLLPDGSALDARVVFSPHITGTPGAFEEARQRVLAHLVEEAGRGALVVNPATGHLRRGRGACVFCPMLEIGKCDYTGELDPLSITGGLAGGAPMVSAADAVADKVVQQEMVAALPPRDPVGVAWGDTDGDERGDQP